jgi:DNA invertase Pin-like site-specific DNA recombinase
VTLAATADKLTARHRERLAYIYIRQSTLRQVHQNRESQANQYALVERALALGWVPERIRVIDADLGQSGQDGQRPGFTELVAAVSLGQVGIVLAYEASRLARNNADWYALLDLATVVGTLIADTDGVYDPRLYNDRLLLGLRGIFSEAELHLLQLRLAAGRMRQIERGSYRQRLPTGLVRRPDGQVVQDPDLQVQRTIALVFERFRTLGSCQKVLRALRDDGVRLPRLQTAGVAAGELLWKAPSEGAIYEILRNPAYAGALVFGRHARSRERRPGQGGRRSYRPVAEWPQVQQGRYPAYLSWEEFVENQARLSDNASRFAQRARGTPRQGSALLTGLVVCGHCGRQMHVAYRPQPCYVCNALQKVYGQSGCLHLDGRPIDAAVVAAFFDALAPAELDLLDELVAARRGDHALLVQQQADRVARAEYEAQLAQKQYHAVDPENRLVAAELERRWEAALRALVEARAAAEQVAQRPPEPPVDPALRSQLRDLSRHLPELWTSGRLQPEHQKALLRTLIRRVVLTRATPTEIAVKVVWVSGAVTPLSVASVAYRTSDVPNYDHLVARIRALSGEGYADQAIAEQLTAEGYQSARRQAIGAELVGKMRRAHGIVGVRQQFRTQEHIAEDWTIRGLAQVLQVGHRWLYDRIAKGVLPARRHPQTGHYLIANDPQLLASLQAECAALRRS